MGPMQQRGFVNKDYLKGIVYLKSVAITKSLSSSSREFPVHKPWYDAGMRPSMRPGCLCRRYWGHLRPLYCIIQGNQGDAMS